jgi:glycosyltransferase involved in cell wall biosynthesis
MSHLTAIILTYNESAHITACLHSLGWADERYVIDSFSQDDTVKLAESAGARLIQRPFKDYSDQREAALRCVTTEWVLFVDADERATPELALEIRAIISESTANGYWIPRHNYIMGRLTKGAGWYPDAQLRLMRPAHARYDLSREVHELVILDGQSGTLKNPLIHYNYRDLTHFLEKQERYTDRAARDLLLSGTPIKPHHIFTQPLRHFWWRFVTLRGHVDGLHGLRLSLLMAWYEYQKYLRAKRFARQALP